MAGAEIGAGLGTAGLGTARHGKAELGPARCGMAWHGKGFRSVPHSPALWLGLGEAEAVEGGVAEVEL